MSAFITGTPLDTKQGDYCTGTAAKSIGDNSWLQTVRLRRRQLGRMMQAYDVETARKRIPEAEYFISRKIDGEFTCLLYLDGEAITLNPGGTVRAGAAFHKEAAEALKTAGVKRAIIAGELYVRRTDDQRPRVHDVVRVARSPSSTEEVDSLCFAIFNIYDLDGSDYTMRYGEAMEKVAEYFPDGDRVHAVEWVSGDRADVFERYQEWVIDQSEEGIVLRSDSAGVFKIKPKHSLDLAVIGYSEGVDDRAGMLHSMLLGIVRSNGDFQIVSRVGGGFSDEERRQLLEQLSVRAVESDYHEVNSDQVAYQMIEPGLVTEISCLDIVSRTSHGNTIDKMILEWSAEKRKWSGVRRLPLGSIISPQYVRMRDDKQPDKDSVSITQLSDIADIPESNVAATDLELPLSTIITRSAATKELKGNTMVRKLVCWKTNKNDESRDFPGFVLHLTDYSPNRKNPLSHEICVSDSQEQIEALFAEWEKKYYVRGWKRTDGSE